jgi:hypothetical protein
MVAVPPSNECALLSYAEAYFGYSSMRRENSRNDSRKVLSFVTSSTEFPFDDVSTYLIASSSLAFN